ncbi:MAG TPA: zinc ribbon domain-containing protein [Roseiflexaceae bacterium]|nr:zinc ribbon domain-containing protein [Roseiflexaceae bacterium]HMP40289.1 zinc ribbon domain-containing protein [Roseiflexaceae bacterium]
MTDQTGIRSPRFCGQCGTDLPPGDPRFCIECGALLGDSAAEQWVEEGPGEADAPATGPTVRLANANVEQSVVGGTVKLPTGGAMPPGMWLIPTMPEPRDVLAIYAPLRAVVAGWSGTLNDGWQRDGEERAADGSGRMAIKFAVDREWFPAPGYGEGMRLRVRIGAESYADLGRTRRGFRYRIGANPPMDVLDSYWMTAAGRVRRDLPVPEIQIMAPPRVPRVSDYRESIGRLNEREADTFARQGVVHGIFRLTSDVQQRTPVGRGIPLFEIPGGWIGARVAGIMQQLYRVQIRHPLVCGIGEWQRLQPKIVKDARDLGLDFTADLAVEWWLDRQGHDGAIFRGGMAGNSFSRQVIAFRRSQIVAVIRE